MDIKGLKIHFTDNQKLKITEDLKDILGRDPTPKEVEDFLTEMKKDSPLPLNYS